MTTAFKRVDTSANRIKIALSNSGYKQSEIVEKTKINKGSLSSYISGRYEPKQRAIYNLAKTLNVSEMWLWGYDVPMERSPLMEAASTIVDQQNLLKAFNQLNEEGKLEAIKRIEELAEVKKYTHKE